MGWGEYPEPHHVLSPSGIWLSDTHVSLTIWFLQPGYAGLLKEVVEWLMEYTPGWRMFDSTDEKYPRHLYFRSEKDALLFRMVWDGKVPNKYRISQ